MRELISARRCHPQYLSEKAHRKLSRSGAFDGLRIHTDELQEVIARLLPATLSHAVVSQSSIDYRYFLTLTDGKQIMDSMDWFDPKDRMAETQVRSLNRALKLSGKVLLRSAGHKPWYISVFEKNGFAPQRVGTRLPGTCIDR